MYSKKTISCQAESWDFLLSPFPAARGIVRLSRKRCGVPRQIKSEQKHVDNPQAISAYFLRKVKKPSVFEICAGAGGQAIGLEAAGFACVGAVEIDHHACNTLRANRPEWNVIERSVAEIEGREFRGVDLFAGGVPCPPFSIAGKQLGRDDERDLFPEALRLIARGGKGLLDSVFLHEIMPCAQELDIPRQE